MADYRDQMQTRAGTQTRADIDQGLRSYMLGNLHYYMATAIGVTGVAAFGMATWASNNPAVANVLYNSPLKWVIMIAPLAFVYGDFFRHQQTVEIGCNCNILCVCRCHGHFHVLDLHGL